MLNNSKFDWYDYYKLAKSFKNEMILQNCEQALDDFIIQHF